MLNRFLCLIKEKRNSFVFSLLVNFMMLILFNIFFYCRYHTVDDVFMEMIACGAYGNPDPHLIYTNVILGYFLSTLYKITNSIPWYGLAHIAMALLSFSVITYVLMNRKNRISTLLCLLVIFAASYEAYTKVQFTKTAAYLATAGYCLIAYSIEKNKSWQNYLIGILFLWNSYMIRTGMFLGCSAVCVGMFVPFFCAWIKDLKNKENKDKVYKLILTGICALAFVVSSYVLDNMAYTSEGWSYYKKFNTYTTQFQDIYMPSYDDYESQLSAMGISKDDYRLYAATDHNDPELFGIEVMDKVKALQPYKTIDSNEVVMFFIRGYNTIFRQKTLAAFGACIILLTLAYVLFNKHSWSSAISVLFTCFATLFAFGYTYFMHGWFDRTTIAVLFAFLITVQYLFEPKESRINNAVVCFGIIAVLCVCIFSWSDFFRWNMKEWREDYYANHEVLKEIYNDQDHLYISRTSLPLWKRYYHPYDLIPQGAMKNYSTFGDWIANTPLYVSVLNSYDVHNPYKDIVNNEKVYLIGNKDNLQLVEDYIRRHYYSDLELHYIKNIGSYELYSLSGSR